jgi:hypothetical protein
LTGRTVSQRDDQPHYRFLIGQNIAGSLKAISASPRCISWDLEDHVLTSACLASLCCGGVALKRDQRANTIATKKTDEDAHQRSRREFHEIQPPGQYHNSVKT